MRSVLLNAIDIAGRAHADQRRKWGDRLPYLVHPARVAAKVASLPGTDEIDVAAAWLHDVLEDCGDPWADEIERLCGPEVLALVRELTYVTDTPAWDGVPREEKNRVRIAHTEHMSDRARRIKMVDRWDNLHDMQHAPAGLIRKYVPESRRLLEILRPADPAMADELEQAIDALADARKRPAADDERAAPAP